MSALYQQVLDLNAQICRCKTCKGSTDVLCEKCLKIEKEILVLQKQIDAKKAPVDERNN